MDPAFGGADKDDLVQRVHYDASCVVELRTALRMTCAIAAVVADFLSSRDEVTLRVEDVVVCGGLGASERLIPNVWTERVE